MASIYRVLPIFHEIVLSAFCVLSHLILTAATGADDICCFPLPTSIPFLVAPFDFHQETHSVQLAYFSSRPHSSSLEHYRVSLRLSRYIPPSKTALVPFQAN